MKKNGGTGKQDLYAGLNERVEAATSSCSAKDEFLQCIYSVVVADNNKKIASNEIFKMKLRCTKLS